MITTLGALVALALLSPLFVGLAECSAARLSGRSGPPLLAPYHRLRKLLAKEDVRSDTGTWLQDATAPIAFAATLTATGLVPIGTTTPPDGAVGGAVTFVALLALARFAAAVGQLDPGSPMATLTTSRATYLACMAEPALLVALFAAALTGGTTEMGALAGRIAAAPLVLSAPRLLAAAAFALVVVSQTTVAAVNRDPGLHQLVMNREGYRLEAAGPRQAILELTAAVRTVSLWTLFVNLFFPWGLTSSVAAPAVLRGLMYLVPKLIVVALVSGGLRATLLSARERELSRLLLAALVLACLALALVIFGAPPTTLIYMTEGGRSGQPG